MKAAHRYNRRQRKKLHVGEFQELGFEFSADLSDAPAAGSPETLLDLFVLEAVEGNHLLLGGGIGDGVLGGFIVSGAPRGSVTPAQLAAVERWLLTSRDYRNVQIGPLRDAWYGWDTP